MMPDLISIGLKVTANDYAPQCEDLEQFAQRHAHVSRLPNLRDRLCLRTGMLLIAFGERLTAQSLKRLRLSEETA